ncbi:MAG: hypothetical protein IIU14_07985 [Ruminococcus sp.]|nr:hypothetical protein [Ruminococcus sp.]
MAVFNGVLLYVRHRSNGTYTAFPNSFIQMNTFNSTPNQRLELKAVRSNTAYLNRTTAPQTKTSLSFQTHPLHLNDMRTVRSIFDNGFINKLQRKLVIKYWNSETLSYKTATVYMPDTQYPIIDTTSDDILYGSTTFEFIEY